MAIKTIQIPNYVMKLRAYPNKAQEQAVDNILHGLKVAYNSTFDEMKKFNPAVTQTSTDKQDPDKTVTWPDFRKAAKKGWLDYLRTTYPIVTCVPATSLASNQGVFLKDAKKSWEENGKLPIDKWYKDYPRYYNVKHPRRSFSVQTCCSGFKQTDNKNVIRININGLGVVKCRGWNNKIRFGDGREFFDWAAENKKKALSVQVIKDNCGYYWVCISFQDVTKEVEMSIVREQVGVDVGIKDIAVLSDGTKYENRRYKKYQKRHKKLLNRRLSRRYGWSNIKFREARKLDTTIRPSKSYEKTKLKVAKLENKIAKRRNNYNHNISTDIVKKSSVICLETLNVKGMYKNHHLANALSDACMGDIVAKMKYKADWYGTEIKQIGMFVPSSQTCSVCGHKNPGVKNLSVREWTCPKCGAHHDRDINAARNILKIGLTV